MIYNKICVWAGAEFTIALIVLHDTLPKFVHQCKLKCFLKDFNFLAILRGQANTFSAMENFSKLSLTVSLDV